MFIINDVQLILLLCHYACKSFVGHEIHYICEVKTYADLNQALAKTHGYARTAQNPIVSEELYPYILQKQIMHVANSLRTRGMISYTREPILLI